MQGRGSWWRAHHAGSGGDTLWTVACLSCLSLNHTKGNFRVDLTCTCFGLWQQTWWYLEKTLDICWRFSIKLIIQWVLTIFNCNSLHVTIVYKTITILTPLNNFNPKLQQIIVDCRSGLSLDAVWDILRYRYSYYFIYLYAWFGTVHWFLLGFPRQIWISNKIKKTGMCFFFLSIFHFGMEQNKIVFFVIAEDRRTRFKRHRRQQQYVQYICEETVFESVGEAFNAPISSARR